MSVAPGLPAIEGATARISPYSDSAGCARWAFVTEAKATRVERSVVGGHDGFVTTADQVRIVPANESTFEELQAILGGRGPGHRCQCQRYKLAPGESFGAVPVEVRAERLREQTDCGNPSSDATSGLVAYQDDTPVGWCAIEPRPAYVGLVRTFKVPWEGRSEDRSDPGVWALTCVFARVGFRRRGLSRVLAQAAVGFARDRGAHAVEAYPITTTQVIDEELHVGTCTTFADAGFSEVNRPTPRRAVMRIDLSP